MIDIILVTYERPEMTEEVVKNIAHMAGMDVRLIVADGGSQKEDMKIYLKKLSDLQTFNYIKEIIVLTSEERQYLPQNLNMGYKYVTSDYLICTSNDFIVAQEGFVKILYETIQKRPRYASIKPCSWKDLQKSRNDDKGITFSKGCQLCNYRISPRWVIEAMHGFHGVEHDTPSHISRRPNHESAPFGYYVGKVRDSEGRKMFNGKLMCLTELNLADLLGGSGYGQVNQFFYDDIDYFYHTKQTPKRAMSRK